MHPAELCSPQCPFPGDTEEEVFDCIINADAPYPHFLSVQGLELIQKVITAGAGAGARWGWAATLWLTGCPFTTHSLGGPVAQLTWGTGEAGSAWAQKRPPWASVLLPSSSRSARSSAWGQVSRMQKRSRPSLSSG